MSLLVLVTCLVAVWWLLAGRTPDVGPAPAPILLGEEAVNGSPQPSNAAPVATAPIDTPVAARGSSGLERAEGPSGATPQLYRGAAAADPGGGSTGRPTDPALDGRPAVPSPRSDGRPGVELPDGPRPPVAGSAAVGAAASWTAALDALDDIRSAAFAAPDASLLEQVYAAGSAPLHADTAAVTALSEQGLRAVSLRLEVEELSVVSTTTEATVLRVVDRLPAYELVDAAGVSVRTDPGRGAASWLLTMAPGGDGWLISGIARE